MKHFILLATNLFLALLICSGNKLAGQNFTCTSLEKEVQALRDSFNNRSYYSEKFSNKVEVLYNSLLQNGCQPGIVFNFLGMIELRNKNYVLSEKYFREALSFAEISGDSSIVGLVCNNLNILFYRKNKFDQAINFGYRAERICMNSGNKRQAAKVMNNMGNIFEKLVAVDPMNIEHAKAYFFLSRRMALEVGDSITASEASYNLSNTLFYFEESIDSTHVALDLLHKDSFIFNALNNEENLSTYYNLIGVVVDYIGDKEKAKEYFQKSIQIAEQAAGGDSCRYCIQPLNFLGKVYRKLNNTDKARRSFQRGIQLADHFKEWRKGFELKLNLQKTYRPDQKDYKDLSKSIADNRDSLNRQKPAKVAVINIRPQTKTIYNYYKAIKDAKDRWRKLFHAIITIVVLLASVIFLFIRYSQRKAENKLQEVQLQKKELEGRLAALELNKKEFIESALRNIKNDLHDDIKPIITGTRLSLEGLNTNPDIVLDDSIHLLNMVYGKLDEFEAGIGELTYPEQWLDELDDFGEKCFGKLAGKKWIFYTNIRSMLTDEFHENVGVFFKKKIQGLVMNAMVHAHCDTINVQIVKLEEEDCITIVVDDDGKGFDQSTTSLRGIAHARDEIAQYNGLLEIDSQVEKGTTIIITIPIPNS